MAIFGSKPWVNPFPKIFASFFLGNIGQENVFHDILEQKNAFLGYKNEISFTIFYDKKTRFQAIKTKCLKNRKIDIFIKGLTHGCGPKLAGFSTFFLGNIGQENDIFPKGLAHGFAPKMAILPPFFFQAIQGRKMFLMIFQKEKTPFQAKKTRSSNSRNFTFFQRG